MKREGCVSGWVCESGCGGSGLLLFFLCLLRFNGECTICLLLQLGPKNPDVIRNCIHDANGELTERNHTITQ